MSGADRSRRLRTTSLAAAALFAVNGSLWGSVIPRLPEIKLAAGLSDAAYGAGIAAFSIGALAAGLTAGWLVSRIGSGPLAVVTGVASGVLLVTPALADAWLPFALAALAIGALDSAMDVGMNAHGLRVQRAVGRSVLHAMHAWWSIAVLGVPPAIHLVGAGIVLATIALVCNRYLLPGADPQAAAADPSSRASRRALIATTGMLGAFVVVAAMVEDAPGSWSGVHLREDLGVAPGLAGIAYVAFMVAMTAARLAGDRVIDRYGAVRVVRLGAVLSAAALALGLAVDDPVAIVVAFAAAGFGAAPAFPAAFQAAERLPGVSPAAGVAAVALIGRSGFLFAPLVIGALAEAVSLRGALFVTVVSGLLVAATARVLAPGAGRRGARPAGTSA